MILETKVWWVCGIKLVWGKIRGAFSRWPVTRDSPAKTEGKSIPGKQGWKWVGVGCTETQSWEGTWHLQRLEESQPCHSVWVLVKMRSESIKGACFKEFCILWWGILNSSPSTPVHTSTQRSSSVHSTFLIPIHTLPSHPHHRLPLDHAQCLLMDHLAGLSPTHLPQGWGHDRCNSFPCWKSFPQPLGKVPDS